RAPPTPGGGGGVARRAAPPPSAPGAPTAPAPRPRPDQFKPFAARHPRLDQVEPEVLHTIWEPAGCAYLLVYGPSGVGKSTMIHHIVRRLNTSEGGTGHRPLLLLEVRPPDGAPFHRPPY